MDYFSLKQKYNLQVTGVIQAGAHHGEELVNFFLKDENISYIALFEPDPDSFNILKETTKNIQSNKNISIINRGLGSYKCEMDLYRETANNGQSNSVLKAKKHLEVYPGITFNETTKIKIDVLDDYNYSLDYNYMSVDVQGFELEVLRGSRNTLKNINWITIEVNREEGYEGCPLINEIDEFLDKYNFYRAETAWWDNTFWGDAFYIKKTLC